MIRVKKIFYSLIFSFALLSSICLGAFLRSNPNNTLNYSSAQTPTYGFISNVLPTEGYFNISSTEDIGYVGNEAFLFNPNSELTLNIALNTIANGEEKNFAYIPSGQPQEGETAQEYYYFNFQNPLSLFYNLTNEQIASGQSGTNILTNTADITNFAKQNENPFTVEGIGTTPEQFNLIFALNTALEECQISNEKITLNKEGIYTLQIPLTYYYTNNGGIIFNSKNVTISYTFMIFNSTTYFNNTTGLQNILIDDNMQESTISTSETFSRYYFYNYSHYASVKELPKISYNPNLYRISISYTDIEKNTTFSTVVYENNVLTQYDVNGNVIDEKNYFIYPVLDTNGNISIYFNDLGNYDISFEYLYISSSNDNSTIYKLPFENLLGDVNIQNKNQRLYIYGYQLAYSDYSTLDPLTNQPESVELKTLSIDQNGGKYENNADITSEVNDCMGENGLHGNMSSPSQPNPYENLKTFALNYINSKNVIPVSTNQTPIKFLNNVNAVSTYSKIYNVSVNDDGKYTLDKGTDFQGFNQNTAGTYLYIIQYTYDNYMSTSGTLQQSYYHYQIFFFEVTNITPTITVLDESFNEIYNNGYTNQSVYVLNDAENNIYDAKITITLSAYDYSNKKHFFENVNVNDLNKYGMSYGIFNDPDNDKINGKYGFKIDNTSQYANAKFTVKISTLNSSSPGIKEFTIDTNEITGITTRNVQNSTGTQYIISSNFSQYNTNQSFIYSWNEKASGATTYGYIKRIDLESINYYSSQTSVSSLTNLLNYWIRQQIFPVSYKLNIANSSNWRDYQNSFNFNNVVDATYVLSTSGLYILEIYDKAGNSAFYLTLLDDSQPVFVQISSGMTTSYQILTNSQTISIPEDGTNISINWGNKKAIYLDNKSNYTEIQPYSATLNLSQAKENLQECLKNFFEASQNPDILNVSGAISVPTVSGEDVIETGISSYNGDYLLIDIKEKAYVKDTMSSTLSAYIGNSYDIDFIDDNGKAIEGTYIISLIDNSNTKIIGNDSIDYTNNPSSFITFNVTSDAARLSVYYEKDNQKTQLISANYSLTGKLYEKDNSYTHNPDELENANLTDLTYKFSYYTPTNAENIIKISYVPFAENGSILDSLTLKYYPYEKQNEENGDRNEFYYTISSSPTKTINIYSYNKSTVYDTGEELVFELALGSTDYPLAGKYVLTRQYTTENKNGETGTNSYSSYDYFRRTITFVVDDFNLISPTETITSDEYSSLESLVGGDIFVNMYSDSTDTSIQVTFPTYTNGLNTGSFYTKNNFTNESDVTYSVAGDKLPISLYIPSVKYSKYNKVTYNENSIDFENIKNEVLSYYGNATVERRDNNLWYVVVEGVVDGNAFTSEQDAYNYLYNSLTIEEYQIQATIVAYLVTGTKYYITNGTSKDGFLQFFEADKGYNIINNTPIENFYVEGNYEITLSQGSNLGNLSSFYSIYKFGFEIISQKPDFDIIGSDGYLLQEVGSTNTYYTNSDMLTIQWEIPTSIYKAKIDESAITITSTEGTILPSEIDTSSSTIHSFTIDTSTLTHSTRPNPALTITMQYEGFNSKYYQKVTKTIYFDISAPTANLVNLMALTENATSGTFTQNFQQLSMRRYFDNNHQEVSISSLNDIANMSYSYSTNTGYFKYYSYNVNENFFYNTLMETVNNAYLNNYNTQYIYYREIASLDSYNQVDKDSFSTNSYTLLINSSDLGLRRGYYEIVERDYAGNMCVYLVYLIDSKSQETNQDEYNIALNYKNSSHENNFEITNDEIVDGFNIYSNSGFTINSYNYKSDPWGMLYVKLAGQSVIRYLQSPWLENGYIYKMTISSSGFTLDSVPLSSIFENVNSSNNKHTLTLSDRTTGYANTIYLSIMDASINTQKIEDPNKTSVILNISVPSLSEYNSTTTSYVFPEKINIYRFDNIEGVASWNLIYIANQNPYGTWIPDSSTPSDSISFNTINSDHTLQIIINMGNYSTSKIKFEITDNFDNNTTIIQLANEIAYDQISGNGEIYQITEYDGSITYISNETLKFSFNKLLYNISIFNQNNQDITQNMIVVDNPATNISYYLFEPTTDNIWNDYYKIVISDSETMIEIDTLHLRLYYVLPFITDLYNEVSNGGILFSDNRSQPLTDFGDSGVKTVYFEGKPYTNNVKSLTTYSQVVSLRFRDGQSYANEGLFSYQDGFSYSVYLSKDNGQNWTNINSSTSATTAYTLNGTGTYLLLIKYDSDEIFTDLCQIYQINILDSKASYYYISVDGLEVKRNDIKFTDQNGKEYEVNYIVSVNYADKNNRLAIVPNEELNVICNLVSTQTTGTEVYVEIYHYECSQARGDFTIIYIEENNNFVSQFTYETASGTDENIKSSSSVVVVANSETESNFNKLKLEFTSYYGIKENSINIKVLKLFNGTYVEIFPTKYTSGDLSYIYLEKAGSYRVSLYDSCTPANVQLFKNGEYLDIIFLNYTPFIITYYTDSNEQQIEHKTEFVQNAVYNGNVVLSLTNLSTYYQLAGYPVISVKLNGQNYKNYESKNNVYTFSQPGYYSITFTATSTTGVPIRQQEFNFTIINQNESRFAYEFPQFENYYIEKITKDGIDITQSLIEISNLKTISINGNKYLAELIVNYLDQKTGAGRYEVTINTNDKSYINTTDEKFTFSFWINKATPPINISVAEGQSTTDNITISFNVQNLYNAIGDCYFKIDNTRLDITSETIPTLGNNLVYTIDQTGTYYVQIYSMSGHLLFSYKVTKEEPLNAFAIIAIVLGVVAAGAIIGITIAIRKKQKIK